MKEGQAIFRAFAHHQFATVDADGAVHLWDRRTAGLVTERSIATASLREPVYTIDGSAILVADDTGMLHQLDAVNVFD